MSLVTDRRTESLWRAAETGLENATVRFWTYVLANFFSGRDWNILPEDEPAPGSRWRIDLVIQRWVEKERQWETVLFFEAKKANATQAEIEVVEDQAISACRAWMKAYNRKEMFCMTVIGTKAKTWYATTDDQNLLPVAPKLSRLKDATTYIAAHSSEAQLLRNALRNIQEHIRLPAKVLADLRSSASPTRSSIAYNAYAGPSTSHRSQPTPSSPTSGYPLSDVNIATIRLASQTSPPVGSVAGFPSSSVPPVSSTQHSAMASNQDDAQNDDQDDDQGNEEPSDEDEDDDNMTNDDKRSGYKTEIGKKITRIPHKTKKDRFKFENAAKKRELLRHRTGSKFKRIKAPCCAIQVERLAI